MTKEAKAAMRARAKQDFLDGMNYRQIAAKYGVGVGSISRWAERDGWDTTAKQRTGTKKRNIAKAERKVERAAEQETEQPETAEDVVPVAELVDEQLPDYTSLRATALLILAKINQRLLAEKPLEPRDIKSLTGALLDLKNQLNALSPRELREQAARLRSLEKQAQDESKPAEPVLIRFVNTEEAES